MSKSKLALQAFQELRRRQEARKPVFDENFPQQNAFVKDTSRFIAAFCTRRAGKSSGLAIKYFNAARKYPGSTSIYCALTRASAKNIMWPVLKQFDREFKIGATFLDATLEMKFTNDSVVKLVGADQEGFIDRLLGGKYPLACIDEAQSFRAHQQRLVDDVFTPAVAEYPDGQICVTGTPGPIPKGFFHDVSKGSFGFKVHQWTVYDNPYFPDPQGFVKEIMEKKGWTVNHPTIRREWYGEWVADTDALVYRYESGRNSYTELPNETEWFYVLGVDLGYSPDPSAFVLTAFNPYDRHLYILESIRAEKLDVSGVSGIIRGYISRYPYIRVVADLGAQGKMIGEEIRARHQIPIEAAEKHGKAGFIELMNSDFHQGLIKAKGSTNKELIAEWSELIWDSESARREEDSRYPNHCADAALYAWRFSYNYAHQIKPKKLDPNSDEAMIKRFEERGDQLERERRAIQEEDYYGSND